MTFLHHPLTQFVVRCIVGGIFIIAALSKINSVGDFAQSILNYRVIPEMPALFVATILPWLELVCGVALVIGVYQRTSAIIISVLLLIFTILVARALILGLDISCGCFSQDPAASKISWFKILENTLTFLLALFIALRSEQETYTLFSLLQNDKPRKTWSHNE